MTSLTPLLAFLGFVQGAAPAQHAAGGEAALVLPDLAKALCDGLRVIRLRLHLDLLGDGVRCPTLHSSSDERVSGSG